jgi:hypothetical protein
MQCNETVGGGKIWRAGWPQALVDTGVAFVWRPCLTHR